MTDPDYNRRMATALGWTFVQFPDGHMPHILHWTKPDGTFVGAEPDFEHDWREMPAILAAIFHFRIIDVSLLDIEHYADEVVITVDDTDIAVVGDTLLLAAGALLLKLTEEKR